MSACEWVVWSDKKIIYIYIYFLDSTKQENLTWLFTYTNMKKEKTCQAGTRRIWAKIGLTNDSEQVQRRLLHI